MNHYAQISPDSGVCFSILQTDAEMEDANLVPIASYDASLLGQAYDLAKKTWKAPAPPASLRHLSKRAFRARFSKPERVAVEWAAVDKPEAPSSERMLSASLRADLKDQEQAAYIDLDDPDVLDGLLALERFGILGTGRAQAIQSAPVQPEERP